MKYEIDFLLAKGRSSTVRIRGKRIEMRFARGLGGVGKERVYTKFLDWAKKQIVGFQDEHYRIPNYVSGGRVFTHNKVYEIEVSFEKRDRIRVFIEGLTIKLIFPFGIKAESKVEKLVKKMIMKDQQGYLEEVLEELNFLYFNVQYEKCGFKDTKGRWGSCSTKKSLMLSYRLLMAPREVFRYVCVHELAHLVEFNHSTRFWKLVEEAMPDYQKAEKWLKKSNI